MKSSRRHELKHNVLDEELVKVGRFFKKYGNYIFWAVLVIAVAVFVIWRLYTSQQSRAVEIQSRYEAMVTAREMSYEKRAAGLKALTEQDDNPRIAALSLVALGDMRLRRMLQGKGESQKLLKGAREAYKRVEDKFAGHRQALAKARLGLARLAEFDGDAAEAKKQYRAVMEMEDLASWPVLAVAEEAMKKLDLQQRPVRMATTAPAPDTQPATQPDTQPATAPADVEKAPAATLPGID